MKRFTLIIDGHNFFFRSLWSCFRQGSKTKILSTQKDIDAYEKKMMIDFCSILKNIGSIVNDVVFIKDSHSWRKELLLEHEYKGNRKRTQDNIDMLGFGEAVNNFTETLINYGIKVSQADRSEGDDLIYAWTKDLFDAGKSSLILSTDKDLNQLVKCVNDVHIIQYSPVANKLYVSKESNDIIKNIDSRREIQMENLFDELFTISIENDPFEKFISGMDIEEVYPEAIRFAKIIGGDVSDNIYPVYFKQGDGTTKSKGLGPKTVTKIYETFKGKLGCDFDYHIYSNDDVMKILCNIIYEIAKIKDDEFTKRMLLENIRTNTKLVALTDESIPSDVVGNMIENINEEKTKRAVIVSKITRESLFAKSRFKEYKTNIQFDSNTMSGVKSGNITGGMNFIVD
jgi:5'-3' exonuclease